MRGACGVVLRAGSLVGGAKIIVLRFASVYLIAFAVMTLAMIKHLAATVGAVEQIRERIDFA